MEKRISYSDFMAVKRTAQLVNPTIQKREAVRKKIEGLVKEFNNYDAQVKSFEAGIKQITGLRVEELIKKVVEPAYNEDGTPKVDKEGKPVKTTKYVPTSIVSYDKEHKQYVITTPDPVETTAENTEAVSEETATTDSAAA